MAESPMSVVEPRNRLILALLRVLFVFRRAADDCASHFLGSEEG